MKSKTKKILIFFLVVLILTGFSHFVFAQDQPGRELEVKYPSVEGYAPTETTTQIPDYVKYIFNFAIFASGVIALVVLVLAGFQWFTSAGNLEKTKEAKDRISAAILGLAILFGSYLILTTINPNLVVFQLKRLRPIISELPAGVLLCNGRIDAYKAWSLAYEFKYLNPSIEREREIKKELDIIIDEENRKCVTVRGAGDIVGSENVQFIYFVPSIETGRDGNPKSATEYGAIIYGGSNFEGKSESLYKHLLPGGMITVYEMPKESYFPDFNPSSIKPFMLVPKHDGGYERNGVKYQVFLFQEYNRNLGTDLEDKGKMYGLLPENYWYEWSDITVGFGSSPGARCEKNYCSPRSIQVIGDYIAILITPDGRSEAFTNGIDNNLDDNLNITNWVSCKSYQSEKTEKSLCAQPAVKSLLIISAKVYY